jgi:hypothetical protein
MVWEHELAHSAGVHTCHTPDCMNWVPVPVLLTWHSTLYNRHPTYRATTYQYGWYTDYKGYNQYRLFGEGWSGQRAEYQTSASAFNCSLVQPGTSVAFAATLY